MADSFYQLRNGLVILSYNKKGRLINYYVHVSKSKDEQLPFTATNTLTFEMISENTAEMALIPECVSSLHRQPSDTATGLLGKYTLNKDHSFTMEKFAFKVPADMYSYYPDISYTPTVRKHGSEFVMDFIPFLFNASGHRTDTLMPYKHEFCNEIHICPEVNNSRFLNTEIYYSTNSQYYEILDIKNRNRIGFHLTDSHLSGIYNYPIQYRFLGESSGKMIFLKMNFSGGPFQIVYSQP